MPHKLTNNTYSDYAWLDELKSWYGEPRISFPDEIYMRDENNIEQGCRIFTWFPENCNHCVRVFRHDSYRYQGKGPELLGVQWTVLVSKHGKKDRWRYSSIEYSFVNDGTEPSSELITKLYGIVGFENYDGK